MKRRRRGAKMRDGASALRPSRRRPPRLRQESCLSSVPSIEVLVCLTTYTIQIFS